MRLIDADVILRFILHDSEDMYKQAVQVISEGAWTRVEVIAEVVYVLTKLYKISREDVSYSIKIVLGLVRIEDKQAMIETLKIFSESSLDFVDCVLIGRNHILEEEVFSFDKKLNKHLK